MSRQIRINRVMRMAFGLGLLIVAANTLAGSEPADGATQFDSANKLYEQGRFAEAAAAYERLVQGGADAPAIQFNLGNARFKSGQIGLAIAAYRRAEQLAPRDPDLRANLQFARNQVQGPTARANRWERWLGQLSLNEWTGLAAGAFWLTFLLLVAGQLRPVWRSALRGYTLAGGIATVVLGACLGLALAVRAHAAAIVTAREAVVRHGPLEESPAAFTAHDGAELRVLDRKNDWLQVSDGRRRTGWLKQEHAVLFSNR